MYVGVGENKKDFSIPEELRREETDDPGQYLTKARRPKKCWQGEYTSKNRSDDTTLRAVGRVETASR